MTRLRKMMLEELERRNYFGATTRCTSAQSKISQTFQSVLQIFRSGTIREYQAELFKQRKLSPVVTHDCTLRFFSSKLSESLSIAETPYPKKSVRLPSTSARKKSRDCIDAARPLISHSVDDALPTEYDALE